ncbi:MAG: helix-turn-helix domain-containing protein [Flavobacterium sp.]|uniref:AraC family transcriptional regulator n=1 Tax=Flavobacterium sp. TaxID=239 RepID=UPI0011F6CAD1|nr:AraC family transcriptional regulator [Flavobacterium sp.]RZJ66846.1 MAG: helix-turn-helix domain-containing protein [Flavobacterium sp.]
MVNIKVLRIDQFKSANTFSDFYANMIANHLATSHLHIEKPHRHNFYATMLFTKGSGKHSIDFKTYDVSPGSVFLMAPGQIHYWELSDDADGLIFFHSQEFYELRYADERLSDYAFFSPVQNIQKIALTSGQSSEIETIIAEMMQSELGGTAMRNRYLISLITQVYIKLSLFLGVGQNNEETASSSYAAKFRSFEKLLETNFREEKSAEKYAEMLHMSAKHLNRINKSMVDKSTSEIIIERVLLEARRMLIYSNEPLNEIALKLGFEDYAYFSKLFKKKTGITPSQFKAQHS